MINSQVKTACLESELDLNKSVFLSVHVHAVALTEGNYGRVVETGARKRRLAE